MPWLRLLWQAKAGAFAALLSEINSSPCRAQSLVVRAAAATLPSDQKIRIKLKAYQAHLLQESIGLITEAARSTGAHAGGPAYLPTRWGCILLHHSGAARSLLISPAHVWMGGIEFVLCM